MQHYSAFPLMARVKIMQYGVNFYSLPIISLTNSCVPEPLSRRLFSKKYLQILLTWTLITSNSQMLAKIFDSRKNPILLISSRIRNVIKCVKVYEIVKFHNNVDSCVSATVKFSSWSLNLILSKFCDEYWKVALFSIQLYTIQRYWQNRIVAHFPCGYPMRFHLLSVNHYYLVSIDSPIWTITASQAFFETISILNSVAHTSLPLLFSYSCKSRVRLVYNCSQF